MLARLSYPDTFRLLSIVIGLIHHATGSIHIFQCHQNEVHTNVHDTVALAGYVYNKNDQFDFNLFSILTFEPFLNTFSIYDYDKHCGPSSIRFWE